MHAGLSRKVLAGASVAAAATTAQSIRARAARRLISWAPGSGTPHDGALHARTIGHGASGVLLLHGLGSSNAYWGATYDTLGDTGRLVVPDLLGFGASPRPPVGYTPDDHVRALGAVLDELGVAGPLVVGAHSLGCLVALALADRHPGLVASIVAFCPPLYPDEAAARKRIARLGWLERQVATDGAWAETVCRWMCEHRRAAASITGILRPGLPGAIRRDGVQHSWAAYSQTFTHVLAAAEGAQWLARVRVPVEMVAGSEDRVTDLGYLRRLADDLPHVTLTVRGRADHNLPLTDPVGAVVSLVRAARLLPPAPERQQA